MHLMNCKSFISNFPECVIFTAAAMPCVEVHPLSHQPTAAWEQLKQSQQVIKIKTKIPTKPPGDRKVKEQITSTSYQMPGSRSGVLPGSRFIFHRKVETFQSIFSNVATPKHHEDRQAK